MKLGLQGLAWVCVAVTVIGFFLPWASLDLRDPGVTKMLSKVAGSTVVTQKIGEGIGKLFDGVKKVAGTVTGTVVKKLPGIGGIPTKVSGFQVPQIANSKNSQIAIALMEIFMGKQHIGLKSYGVYLLPGLALLCGLLLTFLSSKKPVLIGVAVLCLAVGGIGIWKILTTNTAALFLAIVIGPGIWLSLWAYVALGGIAVALVFLQPKRAG